MIKYVLAAAAYLMVQSATAAEQEARFTHARVEDSANILVPFGPRIGRMADAFSQDLGIDVHVVTSRSTEAGWARAKAWASWVP